MIQIKKFLEDKLSQSSITRLSGFMTVTCILTISLVSSGWVLVAGKYNFLSEILWTLVSLAGALFATKVAKDWKDKTNPIHKDNETIQKETKK